MTDEPETIQQKQDKPGRGNGEGSKQTQLKPGYDPRRWLQGRPKKPKDLKAAEELVQHVIWDELSREITSDKGETVDALRLMIRAMIRNKATQKEILDRIAGKVQDKLDVTSDGKPLTKEPTDEEKLQRMKELAVAIAKELNATKPAE